MYYFASYCAEMSYNLRVVSCNKLTSQFHSVHQFWNATEDNPFLSEQLRLFKTAFKLQKGHVIDVVLFFLQK